MSPWLSRFTMEHPWLSAALMAILPGAVFGFIAQAEEGTAVGIVVGLIFWSLFFVVGGFIQAAEARRSGESPERRDGPLSPNPLFLWMRAHPWISAAVGAVLLAVVTFIRVVASGGQVSRTLLEASLLGVGLFVFAAVRALVSKRGRSDPR